MLKCLECGGWFADDEVNSWVEDYGERKYGCPYCNSSEYEDAHLCDKCDEVFAESESVTGSLCPKCEGKLIEPLTDGAKLKKFLGEIGEQEPVNINAFLSFCFSPSEIEHILMEELKSVPKSLVDKYAEEFVNNDRDWTVESAYAYEQKGGVIDE